MAYPGCQYAGLLIAEHVGDGACERPVFIDKRTCSRAVRRVQRADPAQAYQSTDKVRSVAEKRSELAVYAVISAPSRLPIGYCNGGDTRTLDVDISKAPLRTGAVILEVENRFN